MRFLKITNRGTVHRKLLELIGFTTKRDKLKDPSIIGSKGSGTKLCIPASLRLGLKIWFCSSDEQGPYTLGYEVKKMPVGEGQEVSQIFFYYGDKEQIPMQFVLESFADWDKPIGADSIAEFKIVRELLSNAQDADPGFGVEMVESDGDGYFSPDSGETSVFLTLTKGVDEIVRGHPLRYIKFLSKRSKPLMVAEKHGEIYSKSSHDTRIFLQGILIECISGKDTTSLFDYSLLEKNLLSEERTVKNQILLYRKLGALIFAVDSIEFARILISNIPKGRAELEALAMNQISDVPLPARSRFVQAWADIYGEKAVISSGATVPDEHAKLSGYDVIRVEHNVLKLILVRSGVKQVTDVISIDPSAIREVKLTAEEMAVFDSAYELFIHFRPEAKVFPIKFFDSLDKKLHWDGFAGMGEGIFQEIWVSRTAIGRGANAVLETLVHELRHCVSKAGDCTALFELQADRDEAELMLRLSPQNILSKIKS